MSTLLIVLGAWCVVSCVVTPFIGRAIRDGRLCVPRTEPRPVRIARRRSSS